MTAIRDGAYVVPKLKLCKDCKHVVFTVDAKNSDMPLAMCYRLYTEPSLSLVTGELVARRPTEAFRERQDPTFGDGDTCGLRGRYYEIAVQPASLATTRGKKKVA